VTFKTLLVVCRLEAGHGGVVAVSGGVAALARHEAVVDRVLKILRGECMTLLAWQPVRDAVLVMTGGTVAGN
jgi:hypothetical protein